MTSTIFCIIAARNESKYLSGFLSHLCTYVDAIIGLDDGSTDETRDIFHNCSKVISVLTGPAPAITHGNETLNRNRLLTEASRLGADWILCGDADERFEEAFLKNIQIHINVGNNFGELVRCFKLVNLWDSCAQYRIDGLCGPRWAPRMFKLPKKFTLRDTQQLHRPWYPPELNDVAKVNMDAYIYHLRMINKDDRKLRWEKFKSIDPNNLHQTIGYDHMVDETGLLLETIPTGRGFNLF